jgi:aspartate racemase
MKGSKVIGIVGGMGPRAGIALYECITNNTPAVTDQEHLSVILMSFPGNIVDRTLFLEGKVTVNPGFAIARAIDKLVVSGAEVIGVACNTSHSPEIFQAIAVEMDRFPYKPKLLHMPMEVCRHIDGIHPRISRIGVMATNGTYKCGLYRNLLEQRGYIVVEPDPLFQNNVIHRMIYDAESGIKANSNRITDDIRMLFDEAISYFRNYEVDAVVLGCTELSLVQGEGIIDDMLIIDSTACFARALIREARMPRGLSASASRMR